MAVAMELRRVSDRELRRLIDDPGDISWFLFGLDLHPPSTSRLGSLSRIFGPQRAEADRPAWKEPAPGMVEDLGELWGSVHRLLTYDVTPPGVLPASYLMEGGTTLGDERLGYGQPRGLSPDQTRAFGEFVSSVARSDLERRFDREALAAREAYPAISIQDDTALPRVWEAVERLQRFLTAALEAGDGVIIYFRSPVPNPGDLDLIDAVSDHIGRNVAPVDSVWHEIISDDLHIDLHWVKCSLTRRYHTIVTSGMSERTMQTPEDYADMAHAELAILLDPQWDLSQDALREEANYWPLRLLKTLARFPFEFESWLGYGHTVAAAEPPAPFADSTELCACVILSPLSLSESFFVMSRDGHPDTYFWTVVPIYDEELALARRRGSDALLDAMDKTGIDDVVRQERPRAGGRRRWFGRF